MFNESGSQSVANAQAIPESSTSKEPSTLEPISKYNLTLQRFTSCRWHGTQDDAAAYCSHRDVLPYAGMNGFNPEAWCPECKLFKVRRTTRKNAEYIPDDY